MKFKLIMMIFIMLTISIFSHNILANGEYRKDLDIKEYQLKIILKTEISTEEISSLKEKINLHQQQHNQIIKTITNHKSHFWVKQEQKIDYEFQLVNQPSDILQAKTTYNLRIANLDVTNSITKQLLDIDNIRIVYSN